MIRNLSLLLFLAAVLGVTHLYSIHDAPGLHFDEAWAANFAVKIRMERGFWPLEAMNPDTGAWGHYWGALWMNRFGVSLESFRISQLMLVGAGCAMGSWSLALLGAGFAALLFPLLIAFTPVLVMNHRFTVDVNTFHPFCLGVLALGLALRARGRPRVGAGLVAGGSFLGVTSHLLFIGPVLGLFLFARLKRGRRDRALVTGIALALLPVFIKVLLMIPGKDKGCALIAVDLVVILAAWWPEGRKVLPKLLRRVASALLIVLFAAFLFFWEGHWTTLFTLGRVAVPALIGVQLGLLAVLALSLWPHLRRSTLFLDCAGWFGGTLFVLPFLMTHPSSRYFETAFLLFAAMLAISLEAMEDWVSSAKMHLWLICFVAVGAFDLQVNYWRPAILGLQEDRDFKFACLHDSSRDSLPKQRLARFLADNGCRYERVRTADPRLDEALRFLSQGDWKAGSDNLELRLCQWPSVRVEREQSEAASLSRLDWIIARISGLLVLR